MFLAVDQQRQYMGGLGGSGPPFHQQHHPHMQIPGPPHQHQQQHPHQHQHQPPHQHHQHHLGGPLAPPPPPNPSHPQPFLHSGSPLRSAASTAYPGPFSSPQQDHHVHIQQQISPPSHQIQSPRQQQQQHHQQPLPHGTHHLNSNHLHHNGPNLNHASPHHLHHHPSHSQQHNTPPPPPPPPHHHHHNSQQAPHQPPPSPLLPPHPCSSPPPPPHRQSKGRTGSRSPPPIVPPSPDLGGTGCSTPPPSLPSILPSPRGESDTRQASVSMISSNSSGNNNNSSSRVNGKPANNSGSSSSSSSSIGPSRGTPGGNANGNGGVQWMVRAGTPLSTPPHSPVIGPCAPSPAVGSCSGSPYSSPSLTPSRLGALTKGGGSLQDLADPHYYSSPSHLPKRQIIVLTSRIKERMPVQEKTQWLDQQLSFRQCPYPIEFIEFTHAGDAVVQFISEDAKAKVLARPPLQWGPHQIATRPCTEDDIAALFWVGILPLGFSQQGGSGSSRSLASSFNNSGTNSPVPHAGAKAGPGTFGPANSQQPLLPLPPAQVRLALQPYGEVRGEYAPHPSAFDFDGLAGAAVAPDLPPLLLAASDDSSSSGGSSCSSSCDGSEALLPALLPLSDLNGCAPEFVPRGVAGPMHGMDVVSPSPPLKPVANPAQHLPPWQQPQQLHSHAMPMPMPMSPPPPHGHVPPHVHLQHPGHMAHSPVQCSPPPFPPLDAPSMGHPPNRGMIKLYFAPSGRRRLPSMITIRMKGSPPVVARLFTPHGPLAPRCADFGSSHSPAGCPECNRRRQHGGGGA